MNQDDAIIRTFSGQTEGLAEPGAEGDPLAGQCFIRGDSVGRYIILHKLGEGGMGSVYKAYDHKTQRNVALKILGVSSADTSHVRRRLRILREAQALAQLSHPNVIQVYDVGTEGNVVFVAMELVEGQTLRAWLGRRRSVREILEVMIAAGRGLAAAHRVQLIHRDFKPDNVIVGDDGRTRVIDFGLARAASTLSEESVAPLAERTADEPEESGSPGKVPQRLVEKLVTQVGKVAGTVLYMAPEQHMGQAMDQRSDLFTFCLTLYEALYGRLPYDFDTQEELVQAINLQQIVPPPGKTRVPAYLFAILARGLSAEPFQRHRSMEALLEELCFDPGERRRRRLSWVGGAGILAFCLLGLGYGLTHRSPRCLSAASSFESVWNPRIELALLRIFEATGAAVARDAHQGVSQVLSSYGERWISLHTETCEARWVRGTLDSEALDQRMGCLNERQNEVRALIRVLLHADGRAVDKALQAVSELISLELCLTPEALLSPIRAAQDPSTRRQIEEIREQIAEAKALNDVGKLGQGLAVAGAAVSAAREVAIPAVEAEACYRQACLLEQSGDYARAEAGLEEALLAADRGQHDRLRAVALNRLGYLVGYELARQQDAQAIMEEGLAVLHRIGDEPGLQADWHNTMGIVLQQAGDSAQALWHLQQALLSWQQVSGPPGPRVAATQNNLAVVHREMGALDQAQALHQQALSLWEKTLGKAHPRLGDALTGLAIVQRQRGNFAQALSLNQRALALREKSLGPSHPDVAAVLNNLGVVYLDMGRPREALAFHQRAYDIRAAALGERHPDTAESLDNLGQAFRLSGERGKAILHLRRALRIWQETLGPAHPSVARAHNDLALALEEEGQIREALEHHQQALAIWEKALGPGHPLLAKSLSNLAAVYLQMGDTRRARQTYQRALALGEKNLGARHPDLAYPLIGLGQIEERADRLDLARGYYRRALEIRERALPGQHVEVASALGHLARVEERGGRPIAAIALLQRALFIWTGALGPGHPRVADACHWLASLYRRTGQEDRAIEHYLRALAIKDRSPLASGLDRAVLRRNLGLLQHGKKQYALARQSFEQALEILRAEPGPDPLQVARLESDLGVVLDESAEHQAALGHHENALRILEGALGPADPGLLPVLRNLRDAFLRSGATERLIAVYERILGIERARLAKDDPALAGLSYNLGSLYAQNHAVEQSLARYQEACAIWEASAAPDREKMARAYTRIARLRASRADRPLALAALRRALSLWAALPGDPAAELARTHRELAVLLFADGALPEAREHFERALGIWQRRERPERAEQAAALFSLAVIDKTEKKYADGIALLERALSLWAPAPGPDAPPPVLSARMHLAEMREALGQHEQALALVRSVIAARERRLGPQDPELAEPLGLLGLILGHVNSPDEAILAHGRSLAILEKARGKGDPSLVGSLLARANLWRSKGALDAAIQDCERAQAIRIQQSGEEDPGLVGILTSLGGLYLDKGQLNKAEATLRSSVALQKKRHGARHPAVSRALFNLGQVFAKGERPASLQPVLEEALAGCAGPACPPDLEAAIRFLLAQVLWDGWGDRARAEGLAKSARALLSKQDRGQALCAEIQIWLKNRDLDSP